MKGLFPIIRRARRPLLPPDEPRSSRREEAHSSPPSQGVESPSLQPSPPGEGGTSAASGEVGSVGTSSTPEQVAEQNVLFSTATQRKAAKPRRTKAAAMNSDHEDQSVQT